VSRYATRFNKRDLAEPEILKVLAQLGVEWFEGPPLDGWIVLGKTFIPVEIKTKKGKLTPGQKLFISNCQIHERPFRIWRTPLEAIESINEWRKIKPTRGITCD